MPSTKPASGTRDFLASDVLKRRYIIDIIQSVYERYGYEPLETPVMERLSTLLGKYGEDEKLIFRIMHRGEKLQQVLQGQPTEDDLGDLALRYDLTVPLARIVAEYRQELPRFYKRYQIQPVWRADRPGYGRFRELWQCDVDVAGSTSILVEVEVIAAAAEAFQNLGFDDFTILLNHRQVLFGLMTVTGVPADLHESAIAAIDKLDKIGLEGVRQELVDRGLPEAAIAKLMSVLQTEGNGDDSRLEWLSEVLAGNEQGLKGLAELREILNNSQVTPAANFLRVDPYLARGLSYYTGAICEVRVPDFGSSLAGGGRYDGLVGMFSKQEVPACGLSLGLERILVVMEQRGMFPPDDTSPQLLVTVWNEAVMPQTLQLAGDLRRAGYRVDLYPQSDRYGRQFRYAEERRIRYALLLGERELAADTVAVKDLESGDQVAVPRTELLDFLATKF